MHLLEIVIEDEVIHLSIHFSLDTLQMFCVLSHCWGDEDSSAIKSHELGSILGQFLEIIIRIVWEMFHRGKRFRLQIHFQHFGNLLELSVIRVHESKFSFLDLRRRFSQSLWERYNLISSAHKLALNKSRRMIIMQLQRLCLNNCSELIDIERHHGIIWNQNSLHIEYVCAGLVHKVVGVEWWSWHILVHRGWLGQRQWDCLYFSLKRGQNTYLCDVQIVVLKCYWLWNVQSLEVLDYWGHMDCWETDGWNCTSFSKVVEVPWKLSILFREEKLWSRIISHQILVFVMVQNKVINILSVLKFIQVLLIWNWICKYNNLFIYLFQITDILIRL